MDMDFLLHEYKPCVRPGPARGLGKVEGTEEGVCQVFLRQLTILYHFIHYRLDRSGLPDERRPLLLKELQKELRESLETDAVPVQWKAAIFMAEPRNAEERIFLEGYASSLHPLFAAAREKISSTLNQLEKIESASIHFTSAAERNSYQKREAARIRQWALQKSREVFNLLEGI